MKKSLFIMLSIALLVGLSGFTSANIEPTTKAMPEPTEEHNLLPAFPDFGFMPTNYHGRVFKLSQDYPTTLENVENDEALQEILGIDFKTDWKKYILAVKDYVFEGNINRPGYDQDFFLEDNTVRNWYHAPWLHYGKEGREGFHGLTQEGPIFPGMLSPNQEELRQTYAVAFYNEPGGYTLGKVWEDPQNPNVSYMQKNTFPVGTIVAKLLFTTATPEEVAYLKNPLAWDAYAYKSYFKKNDDQCIPNGKMDDAEQEPLNCRTVQQVNLIQMDIMVRDPRADSTGGWVFGTFAYNGDRNMANKWNNMQPVGLMWGNDPDVKDNWTNVPPIKTRINGNLKQSIINEDPTLPPMHLGWAGRLNGPVDNPSSSCLSCHSTAEYPSIANILPQGEPGSKEWMKWFRNPELGEPFNPQATSMDFSFQLSKGIANFVTWKSQQMSGFYSEQYWSDQPVVKIQRNPVKEMVDFLETEVE